ncbi:hypothetical protein [Sorangium sp. So ce385]|uniref:hypothetical protein n=1 Tax=Sorangium sp. So ce385 TaxID=3133308 RepID=UPI003F5C31D0
MNRQDIKDAKTGFPSRRLCGSKLCVFTRENRGQSMRSTMRPTHLRPMSSLGTLRPASVETPESGDDHAEATHRRRPTSMPALRLSRLGGALAAVPALCLTFASPASAAVPGYERVFDISALDSMSTKSVTVTCPAGKKVLGTGARIYSGLGVGFQHVVLDDIRPNVTLTALTVTGYEDAAGTSEDWEVWASANCADPIPGLERIQAVSASDSLSNKSVTATCPSGKMVVGSGGEITNGLGRVLIDDLRPNSLLTNVTVTGYEDALGTSNNWTVTAYAICADPLPGLQRVASFSAVSSSSKWVSADCPTGTVLLNSGAEISSGIGFVGLIEMGPVNLLTMSNQTAAIEMMSGTTNSWAVDAYAICATP